MEHIPRRNETPPITHHNPRVVSQPPSVHLLRRLAAICYDSLLLLAVQFVAGLPLPLIPDDVRATPWAQHATLAYMLLVSYLFFGWFWTHGGQTLGMRAWRFRLVTDDGSPPGWGTAWRRFAWAMVSWAPAGAGFLWSLFDPQRRTWHDRLSATHLEPVRRRSLPPEQKQAQAQK
jgi:uncharacterized RDD family membrane protein YckC